MNRHRESPVVDRFLLRINQELLAHHMPMLLPMDHHNNRYHRSPKHPGLVEMFRSKADGPPKSLRTRELHQEPRIFRLRKRAHPQARFRARPLRSRQLHDRPCMHTRDVLLIKGIDLAGPSLLVSFRHEMHHHHSRMLTLAGHHEHWRHPPSRLPSQTVIPGKPQPKVDHLATNTSLCCNSRRSRLLISPRPRFSLHLCQRSKVVLSSL